MQLKQSKTRIRIQNECIALLNNKGLANVGMRELAKSLKMSPGNLTYHYPKWEYLMDDVFQRFEGRMEELIAHFPQDISEIASYIERIYQMQVEFSFMFSEFYVFFQTYPKYNQAKDSFFPARMREMREALQRLIDKRYLFPNSIEHNYDLLVKNTWLLLSGWYSFSNLMEGTQYAFTKDEFFLSVWNIYVHHLTPRGKVVVRNSYRLLLNQR